MNYNSDFTNKIFSMIYIYIIIILDDFFIFYITQFIRILCIYLSIEEEIRLDIFIVNIENKSKLWLKHVYSIISTNNVSVSYKTWKTSLKT